MSSRGALLAALLALLGGGCAPLRPLLASQDDYGDYRKTRLGGSLSSDLAAAAIYLERHPRGAWNDEVSEWFEHAEPLYYQASTASPEGVEGYLAALPRGPHAEEARARLESFRASSRAAQTDRLATTGAAFERRLEAARQSREEVVNTYAGWLEKLLTLGSWGRPVDKAGDDIVAAFQSDASAAQCTSLECKKPLSVSYELEVDGKPVAFVAVMDVTLRLSATGGVVEATLSGPDLFSRLFEAHEARPVRRDHPDDRRAATRWAAELTAGAAEAHLPSDRCDREPDPPSVLARACDGLSIQAIRSSDPAEDDRVVIRGPAGIKGAP